jgi:hypothetical protein
VLGILVVALVGCGGDKKAEENGSGDEVQAACTAAPLTEAPNLPSKFPAFDSVTYTRATTRAT